LVLVLLLLLVDASSDHFHHSSLASPLGNLVSNKLAFTASLFKFSLSLMVMQNCLFAFVQDLSSCHKKAAAALYFGIIRTCLGVYIFQVFWLIL